MEKLDCHWCGAKILPVTAEKYNGLCVPCSREIERKWRPPPISIAYKIVSVVLLVNAAATLYFLYSYKLIGPSVIGVIIDLVLSYFLFTQNLWARSLTIARSIIGLFITPLFVLLSGTPWVMEIMIVQVMFSVSIVLLLLRDTKPWKLILGGTLSSLYFVVLVAGAMVKA